ncbi:MAG: hypothetical protein ABSC60_17540, partial [Acidobacteriota bacterium]
MKRKCLRTAVAVLVWIAIMGIFGPALEAKQCDRQCLEGFVNQYLNAMVAHDVSKAPFAKNARYTEDAKDISVAFVGLVKEGGKPAILSMRLKIENQKITEIESIVVRNMTEANLWTMKTVPVEFTRALDPKERVSRQELARLSKGYFEAIVKSNSKLVSWSDECYRLENGMWTAGMKLPPELAANEPKNAPAPKITAKVAGSGAKTPPPSPAFNRG